MGEEQGAAAFCARMRPRLVGALSLITGSADLSEELAQEALAKVWNRWSRVAGMEHPEAYTHRIALNLSRSHFRRAAAERRMRQRVAAQAVQHVEAPDTADGLVVRDAVGRLPDRQRRAVVLRYYAGLSVAETAQALGCASGTVKALTHQAIASLRDHGGLLDIEEVPRA